MTTSYFTFGQSHIHYHSNNRVFDKDCVAKVTAEDPRQTMFDTFGNKWSMQYDEIPDMSFYPRGIIEL